MEEVIQIKTPAPLCFSESAAALFNRGIAFLAGLPKTVIVLFVLSLTFIIGWLDFASGWELSLFIFYALPIVVAVWMLGPRAGLLTAAVCSLVWIFANGASHPYETKLGYAWAALSRLFYFAVAVYAITAVRNKQVTDAAKIRMLEEQRQLELDIVSASEHEKQRIGQDLHDGLCQQLAAIGCASRLLAGDLLAKQDPEARVAAMIGDSIEEAVIEARNLARGILPVHLERSGLAAAIVDLAASMSRFTSIKIDVIASDDLPFNSPEISMHLFRIAQESLANAVRHSGATRITIALSNLHGQLDLRVEDNGSGGIVKDSPKGDGMGVRTMQYRARALGTVLETGTGDEGGMFVRCLLKTHR